MVMANSREPDFQAKIRFARHVGGFLIKHRTPTCPLESFSALLGHGWKFVETMACVRFAAFEVQKIKVRCSIT
jgi:hypothetical protein